MSNEISLGRRALAEFIGTAFLLIAVIGSGIAASSLSPHDVGLQLFENAAATGAALIAIILMVGPVSGAHLNPLVSLLDRTFGGISIRATAVYACAQLAGAACGAVVANLMFSQPAVELSTKVRTGRGLWLGEVVATLGLLLLVFALARSGQSRLAPFAVGSYIAAAYFFTSSTSFANPAVTVARSLSDTFAGIAPASVPAFILAQLVGAGIAIVCALYLFADTMSGRDRIVVPRGFAAAEGAEQAAPRDGSTESAQARVAQTEGRDSARGSDVVTTHRRDATRS